MKEIKNTTIYSSDKIKKFLEVYYFDKVKVARIVLNILFLVLIIHFFTKNKVTTIDVITFIFASFGIIEVNTNMLPKLNYYKLTKRNDKIIGSQVKYLFKKNNFKITSGKDEYINYSDLKKIIEIESAYYLYINSSKAFIVDKEVLSKEEIDTLTNIFKEKVSIYKYKK